MTKQLASLFALAATATLLVADSAGPQCAEYETFLGSFDFESSCGAGASGELSLQVDLDHYFGDATTHQKVLAEGVSIENVFADYDLSECSYDGASGTGRVRTVDFNLWIEPGDTGGRAQGFTCLGLDVHERGEQLLPCVPLLEGGEKCTMMMARR
jgi:hypothetical protein